MASDSYRLQRYWWRALLGVAGQLLLLAFYAWICFQFLDNIPQDDIVVSAPLEALGPFYVWLITSIFTLEWA